jgi:3-oxoacyl-[acyl-carrier protein] reductase
MIDLSLLNKNAIVCGSTQGIGKSIAIELAELGANVTLVARNEEALKIVLAELDKSKNQQHQYLINKKLKNDIDIAKKYFNELKDIVIA